MARAVITMIANPQLEDGYTQIANELIEALARFNLSPYESRLFWYIVRKTYGYQKKTDAISLGQFTLGTGIPTSNVIRTLKRLENRHFITKSKDFYICEYGVNKHYDQWVTTICTASTYTDKLLSVQPVSVQTVPIQTVSAQTITTICTDSKTTAPADSNKRKKDTNKRNTSSVAIETCKDNFYSFKNEGRYEGIDFDNEFSKMCQWYHGKNKKVSIPQLACHNWLDKALTDIQKAAGNSSSHYPAPAKVNPDQAMKDAEEALGVCLSNGKIAIG